MAVTTKELRTVCESAGVPNIGIVEKDGKVTVYEADDMDRQITSQHR